MDPLAAESALAVEQMFVAAAWRRIVPHSPAAVAKVLRITESRLRRVLSGGRPPLDLAIRIRLAFGIAWPRILMPLPPDHIVAGYPVETARSFTEADVTAAERAVRIRLRNLIIPRGLKTCAALYKLPYHTLRSYLVSVRVPLALIWMVHLHTGVPYSEILEGETDPIEHRRDEAVGQGDDPFGRFPDLDEPFVRNTEFFNRLQCFSRADPYLKRLQQLARRKNAPRQQARLLGLLAQYRVRYGRKPGAEKARASWAITKKLPYHSFPALQQMALAVHVGDSALLEEIAEWVTKHGRKAETLAESQLIQAVGPFMRYDFEEAARLNRIASDMAWRALPPWRDAILSSVSFRLGLSAWLNGNPREALAHLATTFETRLSTPIVVARARDLEFHIRIWLCDVKGARDSLDRLNVWPWSVYPNSSTQDLELYRLRWLLLKGSRTTSEARQARTLGDKYRRIPSTKLTDDGRLNQAVCMYRLAGNTKWLEEIHTDYISGKRTIPLGFFAYPDFLAAVRDAGLWGPEAEKWRETMESTGFRVFSVPRPDGMSEAEKPSPLRQIPTPLLYGPRGRAPE